MALTLAEARQIIEAALNHADDHAEKVSVCVCDQNGRFIAINRMDGAVATSNRQAFGKAIGSASTGRPSEYMPGPNKTSGSVSIVAGEGMPLNRRQGGLPIFRDDVLIEACGVGGATTDVTNAACASTGIAAVSESVRHHDVF